VVDLPRPAKEPPAGPGWIHQIKRDGFISDRSVCRRRLRSTRTDHDVDRFTYVAVPHQNCTNVTATTQVADLHGLPNTWCNPSCRRAASVWRCAPEGWTGCHGRRLCCSAADTRLAALRHSLVAHQGRRGFWSFGVISVAAVTAAEEELRIGLDGG